MKTFFTPPSLVFYYIILVHFFIIYPYNDVAAIGSTEAPLEEIDGHLQRVENESKSLFDLKASATKRKSTSNGYYYLNLTTIVCRVEYNKSGNSHYICDTEAYWSKNSAVSGKKYPAGGEDFILQSLPKGFTIESDGCTTMYNDGSQNPSGAYRRMTGGNQYVKYAITDDPFGSRQLREASVITSSYAKANSNSKRINSYYVHAWKSLSINVSAKAKTNTNKESEVALTITSTIKNKSWQLYNYVSFNF